MRRALIAIAVLAAGIPILLLAAWMIAIPEDAIVTAARAPLAAHGLGVELKGFSKRIIFGVHADTALLTRGGSPVLSIEEADAKLRLGSLLPFNPKADLTARLAGGSLTGTLTLIDRYLYVNAALKDAEMSALGQALDSVGIKGMGRLRADIELDPKRTVIEFSVSDAQLEPMSTPQGMIPLDMFRTLRGSLDLKDGSVVVNSLTLEGRDIYAKASGSVTRIGMNLTLELMPKAGSANDMAFNAIFGRHKTGPGHFTIPIKGARGG